MVETLRPGGGAKLREKVRKWMNDCQAAIETTGQSLDELLSCANVSADSREAAQVNQVSFWPSRHLNSREKVTHTQLNLWVQGQLWFDAKVEA